MSRLTERSLGLRRQRGVAMILVLGLLALVGTVVADFQYSSRVDLQLAYNARDEVQAEYNALGALRMRALILKQARKVQAMVQAMMGVMGGGGGAGGTPGTAGATAGAGGGASAAPPIGTILEFIPVECGLMSAITKKVDKTLDHKSHKKSKGSKKGEEEEEEDFFPGDCLATSESEHSKISLNLLRNAIEGRSVQVQMMLLGLLADPRMRKHFEQDDRNGDHATTPVELVNAITDWVDADHVEQGNVGDEDRYYAYLKEGRSRRGGYDEVSPLRAKNAPFDSVAELQLVHGIDDGLYNILKNRVTVYNADPAIELSTASVEMILYWGLPAVRRDNQPVDVYYQALPVLAQQIMLMKSVGAGFTPLNVQLLRTLLDAAGLQSWYDPNKLTKTFTDRSSTTWYTINAEGHMGNASRKIRAVFQAMEGNFYYVRVE